MKAWGAAAIAAGCLFGWLAAGVLLLGCAGSDGKDTTRAVLDATAVTVTTLQETAVVTCDTTSRVLQERADSLEEAQSIEAEIGERCESVYQTFAAVRTMHEAALQALDAVEDGRMEPGELVGLLGRLSVVVAEAQDAWRQLRAVLDERAPDDDEVSTRLRELHRWASAEAVVRGSP